MDPTTHRNDKLLSKKIDEEVKKYGILKTAFSKISDSEETLSKTRVSCFENISKIEETDNKYLKDIYTLFHGTMSDLEKLRKTQIDKINNLIIPATLLYPDKVKAFKTNLDKIGEIKKKKEKQQNEISNAQTKKEFEKVSKLNSEFKKHEDDEILEGNKIEIGLADFEAERSSDNKYLLLHYIHSELAFHATSLEKLTKLYGEIMCHDPKELLPEFIKNYNLNSLRDTNLANKYNFTPGETTRKLERFRNPQQASQSKEMVTLGVNPGPRPTSQNNRNSLISLDDDRILNANPGMKNKGSHSPVFKSNAFTNNNLGVTKK